MSWYSITNKSGGEEVYRYQAETPQDMDMFPFATHTHSVVVDGGALPEPRYAGRRILTKLEFRNLFSDATLKWIDRFEAQFESLSYISDPIKDTVRTAFANYHEALEVNLDDPRWVPALSFYVTLGGMDQSELTQVMYG